MIDMMPLYSDQKGSQPAGATESRHASTIIQVFNLPAELLFNAFTEAEHLVQWWKPEGHRIIESSMDCSPGGLFHYQLQSPLGEKNWGRFVFKEIIPFKKLAFIQSFSDEYGRITQHPDSHNWPREVLHELVLEEYGGRTILTLYATPVNASEQEARTFIQDKELFQHALTDCMDQLKNYLSGFFQLTIRFFHNGKEYNSYCRHGVETAGMLSALNY